MEQLMTLTDYKEQMNLLVNQIISPIQSKEKNQAIEKLHLLELAIDSLKDIIQYEI